MRVGWGGGGVRKRRHSSKSVWAMPPKLRIQEKKRTRDAGRHRSGERKRFVRCPCCSRPDVDSRHVDKCRGFGHGRESSDDASDSVPVASASAGDGGHEGGASAEPGNHHDVVANVREPESVTSNRPSSAIRFRCPPTTLSPPRCASQDVHLDPILSPS